MTKKQIRTIGMVCLIGIMATMSMFASGNKEQASNIHFTATISSVQKDVLPVSFDAPQTVCAFFIEKGVPAEYVSNTIEGMPIAVRNTIREIYANDDNKTEVNALALEYLKTQLQKGTVETAVTQFGPITWAAYFAQDAEEV